MDEQAIPQADESSAPKMALAVAILLYVGLYLAGLIQSVMERSRRQSLAKGV